MLAEAVVKISWLVAQSAANMVNSYGAMVFRKVGYQVTVIERPRWIAMHEKQWTALPLIQIMQAIIANL